MLITKLAGIKMKTPVMTAAGTFGFGLEYGDFVDINSLGAIVVNGLSLEPRPGNPGRRVAETPAGMISAIGLENPGVEAFLAHTLPRLADYDVPVIVNIAGSTVEEYGELARMLSVPGVAAIETNLAWPNAKTAGMSFGSDCSSAAAVVSKVKSKTHLPVIPKLSPNVTDIVAVARAVAIAGADAISLIGPLPGMAINARTRRPVLGNILGGLSGPAIKPIALHMVWQVTRAVKCPVIGMGGIMTAEDAIEFFLAGASAVAVGTANFVNPYACKEIADGIEEYLVQNGLHHVSKLVGNLQKDDD